MRRYIFTERDRERLLKWIRAREEDDTTRQIFKEMRENLPRLLADLRLLKVVKLGLGAEGRWERRVTRRRRSELLSRLGVSASTRRRAGAGT